MSDVSGTGPAGRITRADLDAYSSGAKTTHKPVTKPVHKKLDIIPGGETRIPLKGLRRTIAQSMRKSKDTAAHYTYFEDVDMTALRDLRESLKRQAADGFDNFIDEMRYIHRKNQTGHGYPCNRRKKVKRIRVEKDIFD